MTFKRQLSYYIITIYIPTFMIVMVSWMSFWLDHKSVSDIDNGSGLNDVIKISIVDPLFINSERHTDTLANWDV
jgi:hypothetical protein